MSTRRTLAPLLTKEVLTEVLLRNPVDLCRCLHVHGVLLLPEGPH